MNEDQRSPSRPHPFQEESALLEQATRSLLQVWCRAQDESVTGLPFAQLQTLEAIAQLRSPGLGELADTLGVIPSSASRLCDRLAPAGLARRATGPGDRRRVSVALTPEGDRVHAELVARRRRELRRVLAHMTDDGRTALLRGLDEFDAALGSAGPR
ncbi:MarR family winged helix-turn-helix transcriptional regulator [Actinomadura scrupuli]|uniref:MarR family winged helix-turn-helix transcriptional regulator n=1 Tax=Actinomadura scrupuli TaxID=559629 RepID=UPI003D9781A7